MYVFYSGVRRIDLKCSVFWLFVDFGLFLLVFIGFKGDSIVGFIVRGDFLFLDVFFFYKGVTWGLGLSLVGILIRLGLFVGKVG